MDARDKTGEISHPTRTRRLRDRSLTHNPVNSEQFASHQELSVARKSSWARAAARANGRSSAAYNF